MSPIRRPLLWPFGLWILATASGLFAGFQEASKNPTSGHFPDSRGAVSAGYSAASPKGEEMLRESVPRVAEIPPFSIPKDAFLRLVGRADAEGAYATHQQLLMLRAVAAFSFEEAFELFEQLLKEGRGNQSGFAIEALQEHLAALDPRRAAERCLDVVHFRGSRALLGTLSSTDPLETLRQLWKPRIDEENTFTLGKILPALTLNLSRSTPAASFDDIQRLALAHRTAVLEGSGGAEALGAVLAHASQYSAAEAVSRIRRVFEALQKSPDTEGTPSGNASAQALQSMMDGAYRHILATSPEEASRFFDALGTQERNRYGSNSLINDELRNRLQRGGAEAAFRMAEALKAPAELAHAGSVIWGFISDQDKPSALEWIHALPEGPFRRGVLKSLDLQTGAKLASAEDRIDFFVARETKVSEVEKLPLAAEEKALLLRRIAPIPAP
ncbi:MAG: hypothetical protein RLZZ399_2327 [Verrucomicrobiota bacterium]|jgi:hypothetical protein